MPNRKGFGALHMNDFPLIGGVRIDVWERLVFVNLDADAMPLSEYLEALPADIAWNRLGDFRCYATMTIEVDANWKTIADGYSETYHIQTLHPPELHRCMDDVFAPPQQIWGSHRQVGAVLRRAEPAPAGADLRRRRVGRVRHHAGRIDGCRRGHAVPGRRLGARRHRRPHQRLRGRRGVDLSWATTEQVLLLHQYNVFPPNMTLLTNADHLTVMTSHPGADPPEHGELVMYLWTRMAPDAPRTTPIDVRMTADEAHPGLVLTQDISVLAGLQRGLRQPGFTHLTLSNEERRVINLHRNLERYLDLPEADRMTGGEPGGT